MTVGMEPPQNESDGGANGSTVATAAQSVRQTFAGDVANPPASAAATLTMDEFIRLIEVKNAPVQVPHYDGSELSLFNADIAEAKNILKEINSQLEAIGAKIDSMPGTRLNIEDDVASAIEDNITRYYAALLGAGGAWLRGNLSIDLLNELNRLPTQPEGIPLTDYQSKTLLAMGRQISARNGQTLASYDRLITTMEVAEKVGEYAGYAAGVGALGQVGFTVGKQLLKKQLTKAAWTVAKTATVIAAGVAVDKGAEATARALGASEQTIKGIRLATLVVTVILAHRRVPAAVDDAKAVETNPGLDEEESTATGPKEVDPPIPPAGVPGPYSNLADPPNVAAGADFTAAQKAEIISANRARNGGVVKSDQSGTILSSPAKSRRLRTILRA